jgi:hypothetical protein
MLWLFAKVFGATVAGPLCAMLVKAAAAPLSVKAVTVSLG